MAEKRRLCSKCQGLGPFYTSQPAQSWCISCTQYASLARYQANKDVINAAARQRRLRAITEIEPEKRTRRQTMFLMRHQSIPDGHKLCPWCWGVKPLKAFAVLTCKVRPAEEVGRELKQKYDCYCKICRCILHRLYRRQSLRKENDNG